MLQFIKSFEQNILTVKQLSSDTKELMYKIKIQRQLFYLNMHITTEKL